MPFADKIRRFIYFLKRCIYLLKKRKVTQEVKGHFKHKIENHEEKILPVVALSGIIGSSPEPAILEKEEIDGNVTTDELITISKLVAYFEPRSIFEIGTFDGRTTLNMAANAPSDCNIYTLDLPKPKIYETKLRIKTSDIKFIDKGKTQIRFKGTEFAKNIIQIYADSAAFDYEPYEGTIDFVFIDGAHSYEYVVNDTMNCRKLLRNGKGVMLWHDYDAPEVVKALNEFYRKDSFFSDLKRIRNNSLAILVKN